MFGFLKGQMDIVIPRTTYDYGETIEGKVRLELKKPQKAKGVFIHLQQVEHYTEHRDGKHVPKSRVLYGRSITLDSEKEYPSGTLMEYPFQFDIPKYEMPNMDGTMGKIMKTVETVGPLLTLIGGHRSNIDWHLSAKLDVSGFDVNKDVKLQISPLKSGYATI
jgi:hypothetical protein